MTMTDVALIMLSVAAVGNSIAIVITNQTLRSIIRSMGHHR